MSEQQQPRKIVEDGPEMRSVAIPSRAPMPILPRSAPMMKHAPSIPRASAFVSKSSAAGTKQLTKDTVWNVESALPALPMMYFLERTHVFVSDATPKEVARRVAGCFQKESIAASYEEAVANAESQDCVQFAVRLWDVDNQVVVEVQRACGCSWAFHQLAKSVLRASKGLGAQPAKPKFTIPSCIPRDTEEERKECMKEGLEIAVSLLEKDSFESKMMAVESLVHLTKVCNCKGLAAETILSNKNVLRTLLSFISNAEESNYVEHYANASVMRRQALTVLANCLESLKEHGKLNTMLNTCQDSLLCDALVCALIEQVSSADEHPHEACQACRCLQTLTEASAATRVRALELDAEAVVSKAHDEGLVRHAQLQMLSSRLQLSMSSAANSRGQL